jgi:hypothetical protein
MRSNFSKRLESFLQTILPNPALALFGGSPRHCSGCGAVLNIYGEDDPHLSSCSFRKREVGQTVQAFAKAGCPTQRLYRRKRRGKGYKVYSLDVNGAEKYIGEEPCPRLDKNEAAMPYRGDILVVQLPEGRGEDSGINITKRLFAEHTARIEAQNLPPGTSAVIV